MKWMVMTINEQDEVENSGTFLTAEAAIDTYTRLRDSRMHYQDVVLCQVVAVAKGG